MALLFSSAAVRLRRERYGGLLACDVFGHKLLSRMSNCTKCRLPGYTRTAIQQVLS